MQIQPRQNKSSSGRPNPAKAVQIHPKQAKSSPGSPDPAQEALKCFEIGFWAHPGAISGPGLQNASKLASGRLLGLFLGQGFKMLDFQARAPKCLKISLWGRPAANFWARVAKCFIFGPHSRGVLGRHFRRFMGGCWGPSKEPTENQVKYARPKNGTSGTMATYGEVMGGTLGTMATYGRFMGGSFSKEDPT